MVKDENPTFNWWLYRPVLKQLFNMDLKIVVSLAFHGFLFAVEAYNSLPFSATLKGFAFERSKQATLTTTICSHRSWRVTSSLQWGHRKGKLRQLTSRGQRAKLALRNSPRNGHKKPSERKIISILLNVDYANNITDVKPKVRMAWCDKYINSGNSNGPHLEIINQN